MESSSSVHSNQRRTPISNLSPHSSSMADSAKVKDPTSNTPPNLKTWVLRTSIHCEGCKKKVKKILHDFPGVYESDVDLKLQRVTITGNIDVNALIYKLIKKTGKHAELWPEIKTEQQSEKTQSKPKPKQKSPPVDAQKVNVTTAAADEVEKKRNEGADEVPKKKPESKTSVSSPPEQSMNEEVNQKQNVKPPAVEQITSQKEKKTEEDVVSEETAETAEVKKETVDEKRNPAVDGGAAGETEGGNVGKKKKKRGQNRKQKLEEKEGEDSSSDATATNDKNFQFNVPNRAPTRHYPANMYGPSGSYHAPPVYTVSYNTTPYPTSSYGPSYYATPPMHTEAYAYSGSSSTISQPSDYTFYQSQPSDAFQIFSDENPNACSLM